MIVQFSRTGKKYLLHYPRACPSTSNATIIIGYRLGIDYENLTSNQLFSLALIITYII